MPDDVYTHGHHPTVLRSHRWRTAENSAAYLLPLLRPGGSLLDVGCGPGNITLDLAERVRPGRVVGLDRSADVVEAAAESASGQGRSDVEFRVGDVYGLPFDDDTFDVVHAHQVLQHLSDPVGALREMLRVTDADGVVAVRDSDYGAMTWFPPDPALDRWLAAYREVARRNGAEPDAGRRVAAWARAAGGEVIEATVDTWLFAGEEDRRWWGSMWADRVTDSDLGRQVVDAGIATDAGVAEWAAGWRRWAAEDDGWFVVLHGEAVVRPSGAQARSRGGGSNTTVTSS
jgi:ubiquinone/menaquinone biosynthesis C-methylase UbiE